MGKWLRDLAPYLEKNYSSSLRMDGAQGKVVLVGTLHHDGTLTDIRVAKSSGNTQLDEAAIRAVESGPPIALPRPLGQTERPIKFPIVFDLKAAR